MRSHGAAPSTPEPSGRRVRHTFLVQSDFDRLEDWCRLVRVIFNSTPYLVGSAIERADYRDVDIRVVLDTERFAVFARGRLDSIRFLNRALSVWGQQETGLPVDFQVQCGTETDVFPTPTHAMGVRDWPLIPTSGVPYPVTEATPDEEPDRAAPSTEPAPDYVPCGVIGRCGRREGHRGHHGGWRT